MTDMLLELSKNPMARRLVSAAKLPISLPQTLQRPTGPVPERFLEGKRVLVAGLGELAPLLATTLLRGGARVSLREEALKASFADASEAYGRPLELAADGPEEGADPYDAVVLDAAGVNAPADLRMLYDVLHAYARSLRRCGKVLLLERPVDSAGSPAQAAARAALDGFNRSLAKELGGRGLTSNLVWVEEGAEDRLPAVVRFFLSPASAFVSAQALRVSSAARWDGSDPWVCPLEGKVALVTGAARGIGAATAQCLADEGAHVVCLDRPDDDEPLAHTARAVGGSMLATDVSDAGAPARIANHLLDKHGGLDIVVHNAGVTRDKTLARMDAHRWDQAIDINLAAVLRINDALLAGVLRDGGRILSLASIAGIAGNVGQTNYAASKAGLIGMTRSLAPQVADRGITVNAVAPGFIETRMTAVIPMVVRQAGRRLSALGQGGLPEDVAHTLTFLAAPGAAGVTGQVLRICGGGFLGS